MKVLKKTGIDSNEKVEELKQQFGANLPVEKELTSLCALIWECLEVGVG